jgi:mRNA-degrading endonuclease RelE of RelBE toxin-antitoxin system
LPESADSEYDVEMTRTCEDMFKKLSSRERDAIHKRILELKKDPSCGDYFDGPELKGVLHSHVLGRSSDCLIAWSKQEKPKRKIIIEAVGSHDNIERLKRLRRNFFVARPNLTHSR